MTGVLDDDARRFLDGFKQRHSLDEVLGGPAALRDLRVLVIGEANVDEYSYCTPLGKSPKEAVVSTKHVRSEAHAGGALACANHVAGFCADVHPVTCLGGRTPSCAGRCERPRRASDAREPGAPGGWRVFSPGPPRGRRGRSP